jgi:hypothetical protein
MVFDPAVGPWRTVSLSGFSGDDANEEFRYFTEIFSPIYDITIIPGTEENGWNEIATARFPTGKPIKLRLLKPEYFGVNEWDEPTYKFPSFWADGLNGTGAGPGLDEPWRLIELNLANVPFTEVLVPNNGLRVLDVSGNNFLERLDCSLNQLTDATFNITNSGYAVEVEGETQRSIETLNARSNNLTTAPFIGFANHVVWYEYNVANNKITTLHVGQNSPTILDASNQFPDDPNQGLTTHSFSDPLARPEVWRVHRNQLTSLPLGDLGVGGAWSRVWELSCYDNNLTELVFPDGPPPANYWNAIRGTTPGGYALRKLDVSENNLTVLNVQYVDTLVELDVSYNPLTSVTLPANTVTTYEFNDSGYSETGVSLINAEYDIQGNGLPDTITGEWRLRWKTYGQIPWDRFDVTRRRNYESYLYRHTRGVRRLNLRGCQLTSLPNNLLALRDLDISESSIATVGNATPTPMFGANLNSPWRTAIFESGGIRAAGNTANERAGFNGYALGLFDLRVVLVFRNLTGVIGENTPRNGIPYLIHRSHILSVFGDFTHFLTDQINFESYPDNGQGYTSVNPPTINTQGLTGGEVAAYLVSDYPHLHTFIAEDCSNLQSVNLRNSGFLTKLIIKNCPSLTGPLLSQGVSSEGTWSGNSQSVTHLEVINTQIDRVNLSQNMFNRRTFDVLRVQNTNRPEIPLGELGSERVNTNIVMPGSAFNGASGYVCRNGVYFTDLGFFHGAQPPTPPFGFNVRDAAQDIVSLLQRAGTWSFTPALSTDSNVLSLAGCKFPLSLKTDRYDPAKAIAVSRGWQVIDPTFV